MTSPFRWASAARRARAFHPRGVLCTGTLRVHDTSPLPLISGRAVARLSKGVGIPNSLPDIAGLALRVGSTQHPAGQWDVLLASSARRVERIGIPVPARSWSRARWSSLTPFRMDGRLIWIRATLPDETAPAGLSLADIESHLRAGRPLKFTVEQAAGLGPFHPTAELTLTGLLDHTDIDFDPTGHLPPGVELFPAWLGRLRRRAYANSRRGRRTAA